MERDQELYHSKNIQSFLLSQKLNDNLPFKSLKEANFSITHKALSSKEKVPPLHFTPYISILPQENKFPNDSLTDNESLIPFKRDTIIYLDHNSTSCNKAIISGKGEEERKSGVFAIMLETKSNINISKFKEEVLFNCGDVYFTNEDSIIYERDTELILGREEKEKDDDKDNEISKINHNVDKSLIISIRKCFNCSSPYHSYNNCQLPLDEELIKINREKFNNEQDNKSNNSNGQQLFNSRYYIEYEKDFIFNIFLPGVISDVLKDALGILESGNEPPYYKRMRVYGYPPGYWGDNEGDDPLKPKKERLSKLEEKQWNSATLKIYDNNGSESDSLEGSNISNNSTDNDSENSENDDLDDTLDPYTESQKETFEKEKKIPLVYYPGLNLDFAKFENKTDKTTSKSNLNNNEINYNYDDGQLGQLALYPTNNEEYYQYYRTMSDWYYNMYSENINIENEWYNYREQLLPGTTSSLDIYNPSWIITSNLEIQPPPPGTVTPSFEMQPPPPGISTSLKNDSMIPTTYSEQRIFQDHQMKNVNDQNNIEISNFKDYADDDMDLSD